jgi:hypothetical protein
VLIFFFLQRRLWSNAGSDINFFSHCCFVLHASYIRARDLCQFPERDVVFNNGLNALDKTAVLFVMVHYVNNLAQASRSVIIQKCIQDL